MTGRLRPHGYDKSLAEDGRYRRLVLTDRARDIEPELNQTIDDYISGKFEGFTGEELAVLEFLLDKMMANTSG